LDEYDEPRRRLRFWQKGLTRTAGGVARLLDEVEQLQAELVSARHDFAGKAAGALAKRLDAVAAFNHGGCPTCRDAEARAFLAKLRRVAEDT
jgi:hypothetical protein